MVIRRRLGIIAQLIEEYSMYVSIRLVPSAGNLADTMTRIPRSWITKVCATSAVTDDSVRRDIQEIHNKSHFGVDRTLFLVRKCLGHSISRKIVEQVVNSCNTCRMVEPREMGSRPVVGVQSVGPSGSGHHLCEEPALFEPNRLRPESLCNMEENPE